MLTERQLEIVFAVVYEYIKTGEPVGSRTISRKFLKSHSAATIRNEMSDLEEMGYFTQPHSSAGRLPTSQAYRVYVNSILHRPTVPPPEIQHWIEQVSSQLQSLDEKLAEAARFLGRFTRCFSVAAVAAMDGAKLRKVDFIRLGADVLLVLLVVENGAVRHERIRIAPDLTTEQLDELSTIVNHAAAGHQWNNVRSELADYLAHHMGEQWSALKPVFDHLDAMMNDDAMTMSTGGMRELFAGDDQEQADEKRGRIEAISSLIDTRKELEDFISDYAGSDGLHVTIGDENARPDMQGCSVMMSTATEGGRKAMVGLVGPLRMNYASSIAVLEAVLNGLNHPRAGKEEP